MRRTIALVLGAALLLAIGVAPVMAATRTAVHVEVETDFDPADDPFTATGIAGCTGGTVATGANTTKFPPPHGVFAGYKVFDCGGGTGFLVRLNASFSYAGGSTGTWSIVDAWGTLAGLQGSGKLVGVSIGPDEILDIYDGVITR
jgi:hypothetical protein